MTAMKPMNNAATATTKPILAERFKTKMCRNFLDRGECPYESRCMFAHGESELRTKQMNLDDGLVTDDAIRAFKQKMQTPRAFRSSPPAYHPVQEEYYADQYNHGAYYGEAAPPAYSSYSSYAAPRCHDAVPRTAAGYHGDAELCMCDECVVARQAAPCMCDECVAAREYPPCTCPDCMGMTSSADVGVVLTP